MKRAGQIVCAIVLLAGAGQANAVVTPAPDRAFCTDTGGDNIIVQMQQEKANPLLTNVVVSVQYDGADLVVWTGTLISSNWILTCAHTLQGNDGQGGGIAVQDLYWNRGGAIQDPAAAAIAQFIIHTNWQMNGYTNGYDIALLRLAVPVTNALTYPRLDISGFRAPLPVIFAGYGKQGDGNTGQTGNTGVLGVGLNTFDASGGNPVTRGNGDVINDFLTRSRNIAVMDFDKSEQRNFACGGSNFVAIGAVTDASVMGVENEPNSPVWDPCQLPNQVAVPGLFGTAYCDFLGGVGDSGGPAFTWPNAPAPPAAGYYLNAPATVVGVASSAIYYTDPAHPSSYGDVGTYTLVQPYLGWIYQHVRELAEQDADGDGQTNEEELGHGSDPYDANSFGVVAVDPALNWLYESNFVAAYELAFTHVQVESVNEVSANLSEVWFTLSITNSGSITYVQPQATLNSVPYGFSIVVGQGLLLFPDSAPDTVVAANNSVVVRVPAGASTAADVFLANFSAFQWSVEGWEPMVLGANAVMLDREFASTSIRFADNVYWFSNPPPALESVTDGWLIVAGDRVPAQVCCVVPPPFEVGGVLTNATGEIGLAVSTNQFDWLKWLQSGAFGTNGGYRDSTVPRESKAMIPGLAPPIMVEEDENGEPGDISPFSPPQTSILNGFQVDPQVTISGSVGIGRMEHNVDVRIRNFKVSYLRCTITAHPYWTVGMRAEATVTLPRNEVDLVDVYFPPDDAPFTNPFKLSVGPFSLLLQLHARLYLGMEGSVSAATEMTVSQQSEFIGTFIIDEGESSFNAQWIPEPLDFTNPLLDLEIGAEAKVFAGAELGVQGALQLVGITLATAEGAAFVEPYARIDVRPLDGPAWDVYAGVTGGAHITADLLFWPVVDEQYAVQLVDEYRLFGSSAVAARQSLSAVNPEKIVGADARWSKFWPGLGDVNASYGARSPAAMTLNESGNVVVTTAHPSSGNWVAELDRHGNSLWEKLYNGIGLGEFTSIARVPDDGYVAVSGYGNVVLTRLDDGGNVRWVRKYSIEPGIESQLWVAAARNTNGDARVYVSGAVGSNVLAMCVDDAANLLWARAYGAPGNTHANMIRVARDGGLLLAGKCDVDLRRCGDVSAFCSDNSFNGLVMKLDGDGNQLWATVCQANTLSDVVETPDGGAIAVGGTLKIVYDPFRGTSVHKIRADGVLEWQTTYAVDLIRSQGTGPVGDSVYDEGRTVIAVPGGYLISGFTGGDAGRYEKSGTFLMRIRENGEPLWYNLWNGSELDIAAQVLDRGDSFLLLGVTGSHAPTFGQNRLWLSALPHSGKLTFATNRSVTTDYNHPLVDGFDGYHFGSLLLASAWTSTTLNMTPLTVVTSSVNVTATSYWSAPPELAQTIYNTPEGQPILEISLIDTNAHVTWPVLGSGGFAPQSADVVTGPWTNYTGMILRSGEDWLLQVPTTNSQQYFRLVK